MHLLKTPHQANKQTNSKKLNTPLHAPQKNQEAFYKPIQTHSREGNEKQ